MADTAADATVDGFSVALLGLDNAGKTVLRYALDGVDKKKTTPTNGVNAPIDVACGSYVVRITDFGGIDSYRKAWAMRYHGMHGVLYVVDVSDTGRMAECAAVLRGLLDDERMAGKPFVIVANKVDTVRGDLTAAVAALPTQLGVEAEVAAGRVAVRACIAQAAQNPGGQLDPRGVEAVHMLGSMMLGKKDDLEKKITADTAVVAQEAAERTQAMEARVAKMKADREAGIKAVKKAPPKKMCVVCNDRAATRKDKLTKWKPVCEECLEVLKEERDAAAAVAAAAEAAEAAANGGSIGVDEVLPQDDAASDEGSALLRQSCKDRLVAGSEPVNLADGIWGGVGGHWVADATVKSRSRDQNSIGIRGIASPSSNSASPTRMALADGDRGVVSTTLAGRCFDLDRSSSSLLFMHQARSMFYTTKSCRRRFALVDQRAVAEGPGDTPLAWTRHDNLASAVALQRRGKKSKRRTAAGSVASSPPASPGGVDSNPNDPLPRQLALMGSRLARCSVFVRVDSGASSGAELKPYSARSAGRVRPQRKGGGASFSLGVTSSFDDMQGDGTNKPVCTRGSAHYFENGRIELTENKNGAVGCADPLGKDVEGRPFGSGDTIGAIMCPDSGEVHFLHNWKVVARVRYVAA